MKSIILAITTLLFFTACATWDGVKKDSSNAWEATKQGSNKVYKDTKQAVHEATAN